MDTDDKRDEIRRQKNKPWYVKCPWFEKEFPKALNEIDRLSMLVDYAKESGITINPQDIEQRTKAACKAKIQARADALRDNEPPPTGPNIPLAWALQAIDSVGGKL